MIIIQSLQNQTAMAAAAFRPTRGLLIFTLLCLLGLTDSLKQRESWEKLKNRVKDIEERVESTVKDYDSRRSFLSELVTEQQRSVNTMLTMLERSAPEMKQMHSVFKMVKTFIDQIKADMDEPDPVDERAENVRKQLRDLKELIKQREQNHDEF